MSVDLLAHACSCDEPRLGVVDGDTDAVYCGNCEGVLGEIGDVHIISLTQSECEHKLVYCKNSDDNMFCYACDKFMYDMSKD